MTSEQLIVAVAQLTDEVVRLSAVVKVWQRSIRIPELRSDVCLDDEGNVTSVEALAVKIVREVADVFEVTREAIMAKRRTDRIAWARMTAMAITHELSQCSFSEVARVFGKRDHGTVTHAVKSVNHPYKAPDWVASKIVIVRERLMDKEQSA